MTLIGKRAQCRIVLYLESISFIPKQTKGSKSWLLKSKSTIKAVWPKKLRKSSGKCFKKMTTFFKFWITQSRFKSLFVLLSTFSESSWSVLRRVSNNSLCKEKICIWKVKTILISMKSNTMLKKPRTWHTFYIT